jgi:hypothetical protein
MDNSNDSPLQQTERNETLLPVAVAIVLNRHRVSIKHCWNVNKINPMLAEIDKTLCFMPYCNYNSSLQ